MTAEKKEIETHYVRDITPAAKLTGEVEVRKYTLTGNAESPLRLATKDEYPYLKIAVRPLKDKKTRTIIGSVETIYDGNKPHHLITITGRVYREVAEHNWDEIHEPITALVEKSDEPLPLNWFEDEMTGFFWSNEWYVLSKKPEPNGDEKP